jgi:hypothetical protein
MYLGTLHAASNRADWGFSAALVHPDTGAAINLTGATITFAIRSQDSLIPKLEGSNTSGHVTIAVGIGGTFTLEIRKAELGLFEAGTYDFGLTMLLNDGITYQEIAAELPIVDGIVSRT